MRSFYLLFLSAILASAAFGQNRSKLHHIIRKSDVESGYLPLVYKDKANKVQHVTVCQEKLNGVITLEQAIPVIDFWPIVDTISDNNLNCISKNTDLGRFELDLSRKKVGDAKRYVSVPFTGWRMGIGTTPFRFRPKTEGSFSAASTNIGINISYGKSFGYSNITQNEIIHYSLTIGPFAGVTSVRLEKSSVNNPDSWTTDRSNAALSYGINAVFARNNIGIVLSMGFDHNFGQDAEHWSFQNKPWIGVGLNSYFGVF